MPKGFTPLAKDTPPPGKKHSIYYTLIAAMAERKHLDVADFIEVGAGYTRDDPQWEPYTIFPVFEFGTARYYQGRTYVDEADRPTKRFSTTSAQRVSPARRSCFSKTRTAWPSAKR